MAVGVRVPHFDTIPARLVLVSHFTDSNTEAKSKASHLGCIAHRWPMLVAQEPLGRGSRSSPPHIPGSGGSRLQGLPQARWWSHWLLYSLTPPQQPCLLPLSLALPSLAQSSSWQREGDLIN